MTRISNFHCAVMIPPSIRIATKGIPENKITIINCIVAITIYITCIATIKCALLIVVLCIERNLSIINPELIVDCVLTATIMIVALPSIRFPPHSTEPN